MSALVLMAQKLTSSQISTLFAADPVMTGINYGGECSPHSRKPLPKFES